VPADAERVAPLFAAYREFYGRPHDEAAALTYLRDRLRAGDCVLLHAEHAGEVAGFVQLYPTFSSVALAPVWTLNDLYVAAAHRRYGVAALLIERAVELARSAGAASVSLRTAWDNEPARRLYEHVGFVLDEDFATYARSLS
jgi:GNAT superfamily N-acetyltransferase